MRSDRSRRAWVRDIRSRRARVRRAARLGVGTVALAVLVGALLVASPSARAASDGTYRDSFGAVSLGGSNGSLDWSSSPWVEIGESNGPTSGSVQVGSSFSSPCYVGSNCLRINDTSSGTSFGVSRTADLSGAARATLTFTYHLEDDGGAQSVFTIAAASSPTGPWTDVAVYPVTGTDAAPTPQAIDLTPYRSATTTIRITSNGTGSSDEFYLDDVQIEAVPAGAVKPAMWFSIRDNTSSGPPALPVLEDGAIASFDAPGINYEPGVTAGTLGIVADWDDVFTDLDIAGLHLVGRDITVGGVQLRVGDVLFALDGDETLPGPSGSISFKKHDVGVFRPTSVGDYSAGAFSILLDDPVGADIEGLTLVEQNTVVGETTLTAGTLLLARAGGSEEEDVWRYVVTSAGEGTTSGTATVLLEGTEMGYDEKIWAIDLVEDGYGWPFPRGAIVLGFEKDLLVGVTGTAVPKRTLVSLVVARTSLSGTARVAGILAWDGNDLGFDEDKERIDGFTFADLDQPPVFDQDIVDRTDAEGAVVSFAATASDPFGDTLAYSATGLPQGIAIDAATGVVSGTIGYDAAAGSPHPVTLTVTDPRGNTDVDTFAWTVTNTNRAPEIKEILDRVDDEGDLISFSPVGDDPDGDDLTWSATGLPGGLSIDPATGFVSGSIAYTASTGSPFSVTIMVVDDGTPVLGARVEFTWTVNDVNRPPIVTTPPDRTDGENDTVSFTVAASDPDGDGLTFQAFGLPPGITIGAGTGLLSGTIGYDAAAGSPYTVLVRVVDDGTPVTRTEVEFTWTVTDTNRPPVVTAPADQSGAEGDSVALVVTGTDPDGDDLTWSATGLPPGLSISPTTGLISGALAYTSAGIHPVFVRATDDGVPSAYTEVSFTWDVANTNRAPVVTNPGPQSSAENDSITLAVSGSDPDGDDLTWSASSLPSGLSIDPTTGVVSGVLDFAASSGSPYSVTIRATDDDAAPMFDEVSFTWTVADTNRAPVVANPGDRSNAENDVVTFAVAGSDPDGDTLTWAASGLPAGLSIDPSNGVISGTVGFAASDTSPYSTVVRATDDGAPSLFTEVSFTWTVANTNRAPVVANPGNRSDAESDTVSVSMVGSDPDGDTLTWSATGLPNGVSIDAATGLISGTLTYTSAGSHAVTVRATDDDPAPAFTEVSFTWTVANTNRAPVVSNPGNRSDAEGDAVSLAMSATDPDGDGVTWAAAGLPAGVSIDPATGLISGTLAYTSAGVHAVTVRAIDDDPDAMFTDVSFTWSVANVNRAPVVTNPGNRTHPEGQAVTIPVNGSDPDGDAITWSATGLPPGVAIDSWSGAISGTLTHTAAGTHAVTVRATDDGSPSLFTEVSFTWTVTNTNRAPIVTNPGNLTNAEASTISLQIVGSDPDGNGLTWSAVGLPQGLSIDPVTATITGTLTFTSSGNHAVTVRATDDDPASLFTEVAFTWTVTNTNRAPVVIDPSPVSHEEGATVSLQIHASDPDGDLFGFEATGLPPGLSIHPQTGLVTGTLGYDLAPSYEVTIDVTDFGSPPISSARAFTWTIGEVNRPPTIAALLDRTDEQFTPVSIQVQASDPDDDDLEFTASGLPSGVSLGTTSGAITGAPTQAGSFSVTVTVEDSGAPPLSTEDTFRWTVVAPPGYPDIDPIESRSSFTGDPVDVALIGSHPDGLDITWSATGLPEGLTIDPDTGRITGRITSEGRYQVEVELTDERDQAVAATFVWTVVDPDLPPVTSDDIVRAALDTLVGGSVAIDVLGNDRDPEGGTLTLVSAGPADVGSIRIVDGLVLFDPPNGWLGTSTFEYVVSDPGGNQSLGTVSVTIEEALGTRIAAAALQWDPTAPAPDPSLLSIDPAAGTELVLGTLVQSLYVLRVPLALLGGAVFWSLLLGGILNLGFVLKGGVPRLVRRTSRNVAIVMARHGERVEVLERPGAGLPIWRFPATERGLEATGRRSDVLKATWAEVVTPNGHGWVPLINLTEEVDRGWFADDPEPLAMVRELITRLRARRDFSDLVSANGLAIAHHGPVVHFDRREVAKLMEDPTEHVWKGRNPAYPDFRGSFDLAVATSILDAWDHPRRELMHDEPAVPSTVVPVEFTNFHVISIGADVHGPERLDQSAWLVVFSYEGGRPAIIGLVKEG